MSQAGFSVHSYLAARGRTAAALLAAMLLSACGSAVDEPAAGMRKTGTFPNLNVPMHAATTQFTPQEARAGAARLQGALKQQQALTAENGTTNTEELRRLGSTHADDALKQIEQ